MLTRTHLAITLFFVLVLISSVEFKVVFVLTALIATLIPDIDIKSSWVGKHFIFRPLQWFSGHRNIFHSFTFLFLVTLFFVLFFPVVSLGFFLGYSLHILSDMFTIEGIAPFYPYKKKSSWRIKTGGKTEISLFVIFILADLILIYLRIFSIL